jgi:hypothetical protein
MTQSSRTCIPYFLLAIGACSPAPALPTHPHIPLRDPPLQVDSSFREFADSVLVRLATRLDSLGYHPKWSAIDAQRHDSADVKVGKVSDADVAAGLFEATIRVDIGDGPESARLNIGVLTLEFASVGGDDWALLTHDGYAYKLSLMGDTHRYSLDVEHGIRDLFRRSLDVNAWWAYSDSVLRDRRGR